MQCSRRGRSCRTFEVSKVQAAIRSESLGSRAAANMYAGSNQSRCQHATGHKGLSQSKATRAYPKANDHKLSIAGGAMSASQQKTAPSWQGFSSRLQAGRCSHVSGLFARFI